MTTIPNEHSAEFKTTAGRKKLMELYGNSDTMFSGVNQDGESVLLSIWPTSMVLTTFQSNGWTRIDTFGADGHKESEVYDGKWK